MTDIEIANSIQMKEINEIGKKLGIERLLECYGKYKAKIEYDKIKSKQNGQLILVTAISPTPYGEGKTTVSIGLADALNKLNKNAVLALREPSMGPVFGLKGGATGGGYSQVVPMEDINLHFTGDFHAITSANNLLCAAIDNHLFQGNNLNLNPKKICFKRVMDMNDRALRCVNVGMSSDKEVERKDEFQITAASEIMTILCLSKNLEDLKRRLEQILVGYTYDNVPVLAKDLNVSGAMAVILKDALKPNLVQTLEGTPAIIHGGPFANIAHGCNSIIATKTALKLGDYVVTEAGFGSDLGGEKFLDLKCDKGNLIPNAIVIVATIKALKYNAGVSKEDILLKDLDALKTGICNLGIHIDNMKKYGVPIVVALNKYESDDIEEIEFINKYCLEKKVLFAVSTAYLDGGNGAFKLAEKVIEACSMNNEFKKIYDDDSSIKEKIMILSREIYRATEVEYTDDALKQIEEIEKMNRDKLPICVAKTQYSITDDSKKLGAPEGNIIHVREVRLYNGAEFIAVLLGNIMTMPGLPKVPAYENIDLIDDKIVGIF